MSESEEERILSEHSDDSRDKEQDDGDEGVAAQEEDHDNGGSGGDDNMSEDSNREDKGERKRRKKRRRKHREQREEEEEDEEEEDEDEEEEEDDDDDDEEEDDEEDGKRGRKQKKRKRRIDKAREFIDDVAGVEDDDDISEDEEDNEFLMDEKEEMEALIESTRDDENIHRNKVNPLLMEDADKWAEDIVQKNLSRWKKAYGAVDERTADVAHEQTLLPSVHDPQLFQVKCRPGKERKVVLALMRKFIDRQGTDGELMIKSVQCAPHYKGYIVVEATRQDHVRHALENMQFVFYGPRSVRRVPLNEMVDVMTIHKQVLPVKPGMWVRMKRSTYEGDLALIVAINENAGQATLKMVPRITLPGQDNSTAALANKRGPPGSKGMVGKGGRKINDRPAAKHVYVDDIRDLGLRHETMVDPDTGDRYYVWEGNKFKDGFVYKTVAFSAFEYDGVIPALDELQAFQQRPAVSKNLDEEDEEDEDEDDIGGGGGGGGSGRRKGGSGKGGKFSENDLVPQLDAEEIMKRTSTSFVRGDNVRVVAGELRNLIGVVESVNGDKVIMIPKHEGMTDELEFPATQLEKFFKVGDHCKVLGGRYKGTTGTVLRVDKHIVFLMADLGREELQVFSHDLQQSSEVATGLDTSGKYAVYDLVNINPTTVGVIVKMERETVKVLDNLGTLRTMALKQIQSKRNSKDGISLDAKQARIGINDPVLVIEGPYKGRQGIIKHLFRKFVFIHSRTFTENAGVFVARSPDVELIGGPDRGGQGGIGGGFGMSSMRTGGGASSGGYGNELAESYLRSPGPNNPAAQAARNRGNPAGGGGAGRGGGGFRPKVDPLIGKTVRITQGNYKGLAGTVKECNDMLLQVQVHSRNRTITIEKHKVVQADQMSSGISFAGYQDRGPASSMATPSHYGTRTPMYGGATPGHGGDTTPYGYPGTPGRETPGTPSHESAWDPNHSFGMPTPSHHDSATPGMYIPDSVKTGLRSVELGPTPTPNTLHTAMGDGYSPGVYAPTHAGSPGGSFMDIGMENPGEWLTPGVVVKVAGSGTEGTIHEVLMEGRFAVQPFQGREGELLTLTLDQLEPVKPQRRDKVKIISGDLKDSVGVLVGIDGNDGIVQMGGRNDDLHIIDLRNIVKFVEQQ